MSQTMRGVQARDTMKGATYTHPMVGMPIKSTITLKSANAGRKIEFITEGLDTGEAFQPTYDHTTATMLVVVCEVGITHVKFTGATGDIWSVA